jgi:hypothetical protein
MSKGLSDFLVELAIDPAKCRAYANPRTREKIIDDAGLQSADKEALKKNDPAAILSRLNGQRAASSTATTVVEPNPNPSSSNGSNQTQQQQPIVIHVVPYAAGQAVGSVQPGMTQTQPNAVHHYIWSPYAGPQGPRMFLPLGPGYYW